ncbi:DUF2497 domain-containing protein [Croceicoccus ponticola]|uniref:DUF2497 domain-containing protein n=1 Tax=Croceicoccus ponticola TaxID=2217664 RepID=A0A437GYI1_9SPHN|nr:DUF2497 domain-containing protein [Croceicoccus ponticola]RVQ67744.1 DUF2497 domain-containing protein [Croceicoccus ponticola]
MQKDGEPSVEDILRSIKKVISRDDEALGGQAGATPSFGNARTFAPRDTFARYAATSQSVSDPAPEPTNDGSDADDVYDLGNLTPDDGAIEPEATIGTAPVPLPAAFAGPEEDVAGDIDEPVAVTASEMHEPDSLSKPEAAPSPIFSESEDRLIAGATAAAMRDQLSALSNFSAAAPKTETTPHPLEDAVRDMLRPLLKEWLDANLEGIVERIVQDEISRITGSR